MVKGVEQSITAPRRERSAVLRGEAIRKGVTEWEKDLWRRFQLLLQ